jgi:NADPH:quinone reductase-like Zn-dependent oxidoreductase
MPNSHLAHVPDNILLVDIAGLPLVRETAYQGLIDDGDIQDGQTIFVSGGSSSVGVYAIQTAKAKGCALWAVPQVTTKTSCVALGVDLVSPQ